MSRDPRLEQTVVHALALSDVVEGRWRIERRIGSGSMGSVYSAWDLEEERRVAVKILSPELCRKPPFLARFEREARLMARLEHPNLVPLLAVGRRGALPFIVMPFLEGITLAEHLQQRLGKLAPVEAYAIIKQVCAGLSFLHQHKLVHRDVKPQNIFLSPKGHVTLLDLGVARDQSDPGLTRPGVRIGTPYYMAPEQVLGQGDVDHRADLYALGAVLFELFTGTPPFLGQNHHEVLRAHRELPPPNASEVSRLVSRAAAEVITCAMAKDPNDRFQSADELFDALEQSYEFSFEAEDDKTQSNVALESRPTVIRARRESATRTQVSESQAESDAERALTARREGPTAGFGPGATSSGGGGGGGGGTGATDSAVSVVGREPLDVSSAVRSLHGSGDEEVLQTGFDLVSSGADPAQQSQSESETENDVSEGTLRVIPLLDGIVSSAEVWVDGKAHGKAPVSVPLRSGPHQVRVARPGYRTVEREVAIRHGERKVLKVDLEPGPTDPGRRSTRGPGRR